MSDPVLASPTSTGVRAGTSLLRVTLVTLAVLVGAAYVLIALQVVHVAETTDGVVPYLVMGAAGAAFLFGAILMVLTDRRIVYLLGVAVQVLVLAGYFAMASVRDPEYESLGITMKIAQAVMLVMLVYLAVKTPGARGGGRSRTRARPGNTSSS